MIINLSNHYYFICNSPNYLRRSVNRCPWSWRHLQWETTSLLRRWSLLLKPIKTLFPNFAKARLLSALSPPSHAAKFSVFACVDIGKFKKMTDVTLKCAKVKTTLLEFLQPVLLLIIMLITTTANCNQRNQDLKPKKSHWEIKVLLSPRTSK